MVYGHVTEFSPALKKIYSRRFKEKHYKQISKVYDLIIYVTL